MALTTMIIPIKVTSAAPLRASWEDHRTKSWIFQPWSRLPGVYPVITAQKKKNLQKVSKIDYVEIRYFTRSIVSVMVLEAISWVL